MERYWSGALRPDDDEDDAEPKSNVHMLLDGDAISIGVICHDDSSEVRLQRALVAISLEEARRLTMMLLEIISQAERWQDYRQRMKN